VFKRTKPASSSVYERVLLCRELPLPDHLLPTLARWPDPYGLIDEGLRQWFEIHIRDDGWPLGLPSVGVEAAWQACLTDQSAYDAYCERLYGRRLPVAHDITRTIRTWRAACASEGIDPGHPACLPTIFLVDQTLHLPDGRSYDSRCAGRVCRVEAPTVCVRHAFLPSPGFASWRQASTEVNPS